MPGPMGWYENPREVEMIVSKWAHPIFGLAAPNLTKTEHRDVLMWIPEVKLFGKTLRAHDQGIGDCVSHGVTRAVQDLVFYARWQSGSPDRTTLATESTYGFSRVEIGGGRIRGDGSTGAWGSEAAKEKGFLERIKYSNYDLSEYSARLAKKWGDSGVPDDLEPTARKKFVKVSSMVRTGDELKGAAYNWYPLAFCSNQGFTEERDQWGFCDPKGSWAHCMEGRGIGLFKRGSNNILAVPIQQSWGTKSPRGNRKATLATGQEIELPEGVFLVELDVVESRMLRANDSYTYGDQEGFVERRPHFDIGGDDATNPIHSVAL